MSAPHPNRRMALLLCLLLLPLLLCANAVRDIRFGQHDDFVRCVIETDTPAEYRYRNASHDQNQISFQLLEMNSAVGGSISAQMGPLVSGRTEYDSVQRTVSLHLDTNSAVRIESLRLQNPNRLVIDFYKGQPESSPAPSVADLTRVTEAARPQAGAALPPGTAFKRKVVVIDAGHGGHHRGGQGFVRGKKVEEAELTLPIAFELEKLLRANPLLEPKLTRRSDVYIGLRERTRKAEQFEGDIFISIHYNAVPAGAAKNKARGLEIYTWSPNESRNTAEKYLQDLENEEGGSDLSGANRDARMVLGKLMLDTLEEQALKSKSFARELERSFLRDAYFKSNYRGLKSARFKVLENYNMPSVLIEVGFISHPDESARAVTKEFQANVARRIYDGVVQYLEQTDPSLRAARTKAVATR